MINISTEIIKAVEVPENSSIVIVLTDGRRLGIDLQKFVDNVLVKQPIKVVEKESEDPEVNSYFLLNAKSYEYWTY